MQIVASGLEMDVPSGTTVAKLLDILGEPARPDMIVEINKRFVHARDYAGTVLQPGDRVEVIHLDIGG